MLSLRLHIPPGGHMIDPKTNAMLELVKDPSQLDSILSSLTSLAKSAK
jgi:hypothetical protein